MPDYQPNYNISSGTPPLININTPLFQPEYIILDGSGSSGGGISSLTIAVPAELVVTGSPLTGSGTITITNSTSSGYLTSASADLQYLPLVAGANHKLTGALNLASSIGSGNPIIVSTFPTPSIVHGRFANSTGNIIWGVEDTDGGNLAVGSSASAALLGTATNKSLQFFTSTTIRYSIDSSGNHDFKLGIATFNGTINSTNQTVTSGTPLTGTNSIFHVLSNSGNTVFIGCERAAGGDLFTGTTAYSAVFGAVSGRSVHFATSGIVRQTIDSNGFILFSGSISTADPTSGIGPAWKLGTIKTVVSAVLTLNYIEVSISGSIYKIPTIT